MMSQAQNQVVIAGGEAHVVYQKKALSVRIPLMNSGPVPAKNVIVTDARLDSVRETTLALPWFIGDISSITRDQVVMVTFSPEGLSTGDSCRLDIRGTFDAGAHVHDFTLTNSLVIPKLETRLPVLLSARVTAVVDEKKSVWSYKIWNDEPRDSLQLITTFQVRLATLSRVQKSPDGWSVMTDNRSFVLWHAGESLQNRVPAGESLGGFEIQSDSKSSEGAVYSLSAWHQNQDHADLLGTGTVLAPARQRF